MGASTSAPRQRTEVEEDGQQQEPCMARSLSPKSLLPLPLAPSRGSRPTLTEVASMGASTSAPRRRTEVEEDGQQQVASMGASTSAQRRRTEVEEDGQQQEPCMARALPPKSLLPLPLAPSRGSRPTLPEVIESLGVGVAQLRTSLVAGAVWFADGAELMLISSVATAVSDEWQLSPFERGVLVSIVFVGVLFGNLFSGPLGDTYGRRLPILLSFGSVFVFSYASSWAWSFRSLGCLRFFVGMSFGVGQPSFQSLISETTPASGRILMSGLGNCMLPLGEMFSVMLLWFDDPYLRDLHWRHLLRAGAVPAAVFLVLGLVFLNQSPFYLACCGQYDETRRVLESMRCDNGVDTPVDFKPSRAVHEGEGELAMLRQLRVVFGPELRLTTCILLYTCFVLNFTVYGCLYAFPQVLTAVRITGSPAAGLLVGSLWELLGYALGVACALLLARLPTIRLYLALVLASLLAFVVAAPAAHPGLFLRILLYGGYYGIKLFPSIGFNAVYLYVSEVYPTVARTSGTAFALAGGRLASILAPLAFEATLHATGGFEVYFAAIALMCFVNLGAVQFLSVETAGAPLRDRLEVAQEATPPAAAARYGATGQSFPAPVGDAGT